MHTLGYFRVLTAVNNAAMNIDPFMDYSLIMAVSFIF